MRIACPTPTDQGDRIEAALARVDAEAEVGCAAARDGLAVAVDQLDGVEQIAAGRGGHVRQGSDPWEQAGGDGGGGVRALDDLLAGDDRIGVAVGGGQSGVERLFDRVGQDIGTTDPRHAEHDRQAGEDRAGLAAEQSFERDRCHRPVTSCMAASTSAAVDRRISLTICPSARKRIRSASAAAWGSCVTITVVWPSSSTEWRSSASTSFEVL